MAIRPPLSGGCGFGTELVNQLPGDEERTRQLVSAKRRATLLLLTSALAFFVLVLTGEPTGWRGFLIAAAEGSLVGGLADWFAVTALFGRPLGLPIPHTAIVVERKDQFAATFAEFVQSSFLRPDLIDRALRRQDPLRGFARWLEEPGHAAVAEAELATLARTLLDQFSWGTVPSVLRERLRRELKNVPFQRLSQESWEAAAAGHRLEPAVDRLLDFADDYVAAQEETARHLAREHSPWWLPSGIRDRLVDQLLGDAHRLLTSMAEDHSHPLRRDLEDRLVELGRAVLHSPRFEPRTVEVIDQLLDNEAFGQWLSARVEDTRRGLGAALEDPTSRLRRGLRDRVAGFAHVIDEDDALREQLEERLYRAVRVVSERFQFEFGNLAGQTIEQWDAREAAGRLQALMGPDLQWVRINGTIVGGLVGLLIHAVAELARS